MSKVDYSLWKPACEIKQLRLRAKMLADIRHFFQQRSVLEVETPLLCHAAGTDPQLDFFTSQYYSSPNTQEMFLQTSPEFAMKRLLAAGSGSIYQVCKAFRQGESGRLHNPEFTILEWYRLDYTSHQLMDEVTELLAEVLNQPTLSRSIEKICYTELFEKVTGLNPLIFCHSHYSSYAEKNSINDAINLCQYDHSMWLDFIFSHQVQPVLKKIPLCMVFDYPAIQSSLARISSKNNAIADRFEVFVNGVEIANGFFELTDANEQEQRFDKENQCRKEQGLVTVEKDQLFLQALKTGLPDCSGVALGLDRLLMIKAGVNELNDVLAFPIGRA